MSAIFHNMQRRLDHSSDNVVENADIDPVTFFSSDLIPDVRLMVFNKEYHVHSAVLRVKSGYFRASFDSQAIGPGPLPAQFLYDYISVFDEEGTDWSLQLVNRDSPTPEPYTGPAIGFREKSEATAFFKLLCAIYTRPYKIRDVEELETVTNQAETYRALPALSNTLTVGLFRSPMFASSTFDQCCCRALLIAKKLRHPLLFREAFIHAAGRWQEPVEGQEVYEELVREDSELATLLDKAWIGLSKDVLKIQQVLMWKMSMDSASFIDLPEIFSESNLERGDQMTERALFYQKLYDYLSDCVDKSDGGRLRVPGHDSDSDSLRVITNQIQSDLCVPLRKILENKLYFDFRPSVHYWNQQHFLSIDIKEEDMPWDMLETDW
ncbi:hypothetical protein LZ554_003182 [Drepanopeziza brunnea f. sp. 'monogermtubi']|nr:hypothetical protein LZ554_003182 [Drepanopeziza brunnea f. sp. 'monogermtubi']